MGCCRAPVSAGLVDLHSERIFQKIMGFVRKVDFTLLSSEGITSSFEREAMQDGNYSDNGTREAQLLSLTSSRLFPVVEMLSQRFLKQFPEARK